MKVLAAEPNIGMSLTEAHDFLGTGSLLMQLGTVDRKGDPNVHTVWYAYDPQPDKLYFVTRKESKKAGNINHKRRVYFCIDDDKPPQKGVRGKAKARIVKETDRSISMMETILRKYLGTVGGPFGTLLMNNVRNGTSIIVELSPEYFSTWDYSKAKM